MKLDCSKILENVEYINVLICEARELVILLEELHKAESILHPQKAYLLLEYKKQIEHLIEINKNQQRILQELVKDFNGLKNEMLMGLNDAEHKLKGWMKG